MDRLYALAVNGAAQRAAVADASEGCDRGKRPLAQAGNAASDAGKRARHGGDAAACDPAHLKPQHGGDKNVPAHRGAFKRHLRKHTLLFQREGGETARAFLVTCDQGREAKAIQSGVELIKLALASLADGGADAAAPPADAPASGAGSRAHARSAQDADAPQEGRDAAAGARSVAGAGADEGTEETWVIDPGCNGLACVSVEKKGVDPRDVLAWLFDFVDNLGQREDKRAIRDFYHRHKHCHRFIPMQVMCRAVEAEIESAVRQLLHAQLSAAKPTTFAVVCDVRSCNALKRKDLITKVAALVDSQHRVHLKEPETLIVVQVIKAACGISIPHNAARYMHSQKSTFNLMLHAQSFFDPVLPAAPSAAPACGGDIAQASAPHRGDSAPGSGAECLATVDADAREKEPP